MAIDPVRLARIRARLLAASALAVPACGGGVPEHVNERPRDEVYVNYAAPDPKPVDGPVNDRGNEPPAQPTPTAPNVNTPAPDSTTQRTPSVNDIPPAGQTINVASADEPSTINTVQRPPAIAPKPKQNVNSPEPLKQR